MSFPYVQAKHFKVSDRGPGDCAVLVLHSMEYPERVQSAEWCAGFFADPQGPNGPIVASAHYCVDANSIMQCVLEKDVAWHAGPVNEYSIGIEHAGYAGQTAEQWRDEYSTSMLERSAELVAGLCLRYSIPVKRLTAQDLKGGVHRGITGHADVTDGLQGGKGHRDPGEHFPWAWYLARVQAYCDGNAGDTDAALEPVVTSIVPSAGESADTLPALPASPAVAAPSEPFPLDLSLFVEVACEGVRWLVSPIYVAPVSMGQAQEIAFKAGFELPSPALVDAIWKAADLKIDATLMVRHHDGTPKTMDSPETHAAQTERLEHIVGDRSLGKDYRLLAGAYKDVCVNAQGKLGLYGWQRANGEIIQPFYYGHALAWRDYSQGARLVKRIVSE